MASKRKMSPEKDGVDSTSKRFGGLDSQSKESQQNQDDIIRSLKKEKPDEDERGLNEEEEDGDGDEEKPDRDAEAQREKMDDLVLTLQPQQWAAVNAVLAAVEKQHKKMDDLLPTLRPQQRAVVDAVLAAVKKQQPLGVSVDAPAGTGMTHTFNALLAALRAEGRVALAVAFTGVGATLLDGGRTFHSQFGVKRLDDNSNSKINVQEWSNDLADLIRRTDVILCDEAPMVHRRLLEELNQALQVVMKPLGGSEQPFGGKVVVLGGDFRQVLEIIKKGTQEEIDGCMLMSSLWGHFEQKFKLEKNMRVRQAAERHAKWFADWLLRLGEGLEATRDDEIQLKELCMDNLSEAIQWLYDDFERADDPDWLMSRAVLATTNPLVDYINSQVTKKLPGKATKLTSTDSCVGCTEMSDEDMNSRCPSGFPPHKLRLRPGMPVMLLKRVNPAKGLCSGIRLTITEPLPQSPDDTIKATIACGPRKGKPVDLEREFFHTPSDARDNWKRYQFPVKPAFAMTIHKAQGLTLHKVAVTGKMFTHGQLLTAASRVGRADDLRFFSTSEAKTSNVVYQEVLALLKRTQEEKKK